jgi:hypothetical protein
MVVDDWASAGVADSLPLQAGWSFSSTYLQIACWRYTIRCPQRQLLFPWAVMCLSLPKMFLFDFRPLHRFCP